MLEQEAHSLHAHLNQPPLPRGAVLDGELPPQLCPHPASAPALHGFLDAVVERLALQS